MLIILRCQMVATFSETRAFTSINHTEKKVWAFKNIRKTCFSDTNFNLKKLSWLLSVKFVHSLPGNDLQKMVKTLKNDQKNKLFCSHSFVLAFRVPASEIIMFWLFYVWRNLWWLLSVKSVSKPPENIWLDKVCNLQND